MTIRNNALHLRNIRLSRRDGSTSRVILDIPQLEVAAGETICLHGASGSGKTTLLQLLAGLSTPDRLGKEGRHGEILWGDVNIAALTERERDIWRSRHVGLIFQDFQLFPGLSALQNVLLPVTFRHWSVPEHLHNRALELLTGMGIFKVNSETGRFSRGEMQRVAIARALLFEPDILLADEPTASLDKENAEAVIALLLGRARELGCTLLIVSHETSLPGRTHRTFTLERGKLSEA